MADVVSYSYPSWCSTTHHLVISTDYGEERIPINTNDDLDSVGDGTKQAYLVMTRGFQLYRPKTPETRRFVPPHRINQVCLEVIPK